MYEPSDLAVEAAARDVHLDYRVVIKSAICLAATEDEHADALRIMAKLASVE